MYTERSPSMQARRSLVARIGLFALIAATSLGCAVEPESAGIEAAAPAPPPQGFITADFRAHLQPGARKITFERVRDHAGEPGIGPQDVTDLTITQDTIAGSGPANSVELVTNTVGYDAACPSGFQSGTFCGNVTFRHFYGLSLSDVHVQVTKVTDVNGAVITGHGGINNDASLHGLDPSQGLWKYTATGASNSGVVGRSPNNQATRDWVFANPDNADTYIYLRAVASLYPTEWFNPGYTTTQSAPPQGGQPGIIHYDYSRNTACRGTNWRMVASFFGAYTGSHDITVPGHAGDTSLDVHFAVPFGTDGGFYFRNLDDTGCSQYDSNNSANWHATLQTPTPAIHFKPGYAQVVEGTLKAGGTIAVDYELKRLACLAIDSNDRLPSGQLAMAYYRFPNLGASFTGVSLTGLPYGVPATVNGKTGELQVAPTIQVPVGANQIEFYFQGNNSNCYDSNNSNNYFFTISP
jgi:hypothetical protein